jgi:hypothetical protein
MAFMGSARDRVGGGPHVLSGASATRRPSTWQRIALELIGTFFVLVGIAVGVLTLCFALVLVHGIMH